MIRCHLPVPFAALALLAACTGNANSTGTSSAGGALANIGGPAAGGAVSGGVASGGTVSSGGTASSGGRPGSSGDGDTALGGSTTVGGPGGGGDALGGAAPGDGGGVSGGACTGPTGSISGALATGIAFMDTDGKRVNAHGGGIIREGDTFYLHGEVFSSTSTTNDFVGFSMYSSKDLATWKNEGIILPTQVSGELGPNRKGESSVRAAVSSCSTRTPRRKTIRRTARSFSPRRRR